MKHYTIVFIAIIALFFAVGVFIYPQMPDIMVSHWGPDGQGDGYTDKFWGVFLMPIIAVSVMLMLLLIPKLDPLKENIRKFEKYFDRFVVVMLLFLMYLYVLMLFYNSGQKFDMTVMLMPAFAVLVYFLGILTEHAERNWTIGIRTPWTLSSESVWNKTHKLAGRLYKYSAGVVILGIFSGKWSIVFLLIPLLGVSLYLVLYSYLEFKKEKK